VLQLEVTICGWDFGDAVGELGLADWKVIPGNERCSLLDGFVDAELPLFIDFKPYNEIEPSSRVSSATHLSRQVMTLAHANAILGDSIVAIENWLVGTAVCQQRSPDQRSPILTVDAWYTAIPTNPLASLIFRGAGQSTIFCTFFCSGHLPSALQTIPTIVIPGIPMLDVAPDI